MDLYVYNKQLDNLKKEEITHKVLFDKADTIEEEQFIL